MPAVMLVVFALTLFISASLLFLIEPMVGKMMLPLLGGTPAVWNTCMVFYQAILLAGYGYAHAVTERIGSRNMTKLHLVILSLPILSFIVNAMISTGPLEPSQWLILGNEGNPIPVLLLVLTLCVGVPLFVVCTSAPVLQRWFSSTDHPLASDPYFLYGASNLGSMLTLVMYPFVIESTLGLRSQATVSVVGYFVLAGMTAFCAYLMLQSKPAPTLAPAGGPTPTPTPAAEPQTNVTATPSTEAPKEPTPTGVTTTPTAEEKIITAPKPRPKLLPQQTADRPVDWLRRVRWVALAAVPSSLMLGVTTYMTTDIAAIPLLWMFPLALYLLTFIIVFQKFTPMQSSIVVAVLAAVALGGVAFFIAPTYFNEEGSTGLRAIQFLLIVGMIFAGLYLPFKVRDVNLIHRSVVVVTPLMVLLIVFLMLSSIRIGSTPITISVHLACLFVVAMMCHGELSQDRPGPANLTEFFLWMSFGGVVGGLFNGLLGPKIFNSHLEYPFGLLMACILLPPLGLRGENKWARRVDITLAVIFAFSGALLFVLWMRADGDDEKLADGAWQAVPWFWTIVGLLGGVGLGAWATLKGLGVPPSAGDQPEEDRRADKILDIVLPVTMLIFCFGMAWGLSHSPIAEWLVKLGRKVKMDSPRYLVLAFKFGIPTILCYVFIERSVRFGLGVGALLLAFSVSEIMQDPPLHQDRSFFGVLKVETRPTYFPSYQGYMEDVNRRGRNPGLPPRAWKYETTRLLHGTTLHGEQIVDAGSPVGFGPRAIPLSYYHRTGPAGLVYGAYNTDPSRAFACIGLGTGSMACYGLPGQRVDFYDIDPVVVGISYNSREYFTFIDDAVKRGTNISLILGDARLTMDPRGDKGDGRRRLTPMGKDRVSDPGEQTYDSTNLKKDQKYRLIVVDAFSSDAIPVHLITQEAIEIYLNRLDEDGVLCVHISNRYLDLEPVLANIVTTIRARGYEDRVGTSGLIPAPDLTGYHMSDDDALPPGKSRSHWVMIVKHPRHMAALTEREPRFGPHWDSKEKVVPKAIDDPTRMRLAPRRVRKDPLQLGLLGVMCWPGTSTGFIACQGLAHCSSAVIYNERVEMEKKVFAGEEYYPSEWEPIGVDGLLYRLQRLGESRDMNGEKIFRAGDTEKLRELAEALQDPRKRRGTQFKQLEEAQDRIKKRARSVWVALSQEERRLSGDREEKKKGEIKVYDERWQSIRNLAEGSTNLLFRAKERLEEIDNKLKEEQDINKRRALAEQLLGIAAEVQRLRPEIAKELSGFLVNVSAEKTALTEAVKQQAKTERTEKLNAILTKLNDASHLASKLEKSMGENPFQKSLGDLGNEFDKASRALDLADKNAEDAKRKDVNIQIDRIQTLVKHVVDQFEREVYSLGADKKVLPNCLTSLRLDAESMVDGKLRESAEVDRRQDSARLVYRTVQEMEKKVKRLQRVGVWTDDYSNLLAIFNW